MTSPLELSSGAYLLRFSWEYQVPLYAAAQCIGSITASFMLRWILHPAAYEGATLPTGSDVQSFLLEIVITFILMFVIAAVSTDTRAVRSKESVS